MLQGFKFAGQHPDFNIKLGYWTSQAQYLIEHVKSYFDTRFCAVTSHFELVLSQEEFMQKSNFKCCNFVCTVVVSTSQFPFGTCLIKIYSIIKAIAVTFQIKFLFKPNYNICEYFLLKK